jgi:hypothetical protein
MSDLTSGELAAPLPASAEIQARLRDFLSRKTFHLPRRIEALLATVSAERIGSSLRALMDHLRRERPVRAAGEREWLLLVERIHDHGRQGTIEGYEEYLFPVEFKA